jgi:hypothetical protein
MLNDFKQYDNKYSLFTSSGKKVARYIWDLSTWKIEKGNINWGLLGTSNIYTILRIWVETTTAKSSIRDIAKFVLK